MDLQLHVLNGILSYDNVVKNTFTFDILKHFEKQITWDPDSACFPLLIVVLKDNHLLLTKYALFRRCCVRYN
jgi:hypothetical protein